MNGTLRLLVQQVFQIISVDLLRRSIQNILFMDELPKTISGKIKRTQIRKQDSGQDDPDVYGESI